VPAVGGAWPSRDAGDDCFSSSSRRHGRHAADNFSSCGRRVKRPQGISAGLFALLIRDERASC